MVFRIAETVVLLSMGLFAAALAGGYASAEDAKALCKIEATRSERDLHLEASAWANAVMPARYRLSVTKVSSAGKTASVQYGEVHLIAGRQTPLASMSLDPSAVGSYHADLSVVWSEGHVSCSSP